MSEEFESVNIRKQNRYLSHKPKPGLYWCSRCDRGVVSDGKKCRLCGCRCRNRKPSKKQDICE